MTKEIKLKKYRAIIHRKEIVYSQAIFEDLAESEEEFRTFLESGDEELYDELEFKEKERDYEGDEVSDIEEIVE